MPLDRRRIAMLREMGVPFWSPPWLEEVVPSGPAGPFEVATPATLTASAAPAAPEAPPASGITPQAPRSSPQRAAGAPVGGSVPPSSSAMPTAPLQAPAGHRSGAQSLEPAAVASMDWPALQETVRQCQACTLCQSRTHTVFGVGHPRAHWMVVGEAPGEQEDLRGEPFVGPAGALLDRMLAALGLSREPSVGDPGGAGADPARQVYITNTLKCRPPRNRNPEPVEMQRCEPFLQRQIALVQPRLILAMGRFAVQALLRTDEAIGRLRGRVHRYQGVPLVVTYHPAYLLRNPVDKAKAWDDLCLAAQTLAPAATAE
ncbi:MAG: hypothetical protein RLZ83_738 [Pseudomonadota bacterium]